MRRGTPSYIFVFPTIRSRSDLQTSCSECTRRRWLRGSIAYSVLTGWRAFRRMFIRAGNSRSASTLDRSSSYRAPTASKRTLGRMESSKFELISGTLSWSCRATDASWCRRCCNYVYITRNGLLANQNVRMSRRCGRARPTYVVLTHFERNVFAEWIPRSSDNSNIFANIFRNEINFKIF